jgi:chain length determinant protein EpsF
MTPARLLLVLKSRWVLVLLVWLAVIALVGLVTALQPRAYTATSVLLVDVKAADPLGTSPTQPGQADAYMAAQMDIILSERVARQVIAAQNLADGLAGNVPGNAAASAAGVGAGVAADKVPARATDVYRQRWQSDTGGQGDYIAWLSDELRKNLEVRPAKESGVIRIFYTAPDREEAARMANAYVKAYSDTALQLRVEPARQHSNFFDERSRQLRERLEVAQARLSDYQRSNGLVAVGSEDRLDIETTRLNELSTQLTQLQGLAGESNSRQAQARSAGDRTPEVIANPTIAGLNAELSRQQARLSEMATRLGDQHPSIVELRANVAQLRNQVAAETRRVTASLGVNDAVNQSRIAQVRTALDAQRAKVLQLKTLRDEAAVLQREVQQAQAAFDSLGARATQALLESQSNLSNVSVLKTATPPPKSSSRQFAVNLPVAALLGLVLAVAVAIWRELHDRRLRTAQDVQEVLDLPLLVEIPRARGPRPAGQVGAAPWLQRLGYSGSPASESAPVAERRG